MEREREDREVVLEQEERGNNSEASDLKMTVDTLNRKYCNEWQHFTGFIPL